MVKLVMFYDIKRLKRMGLSKNRVSQKTGLNIRTVRKYWDMTEEEFQKCLGENRFREKEFDSFKDDVLELYRENEFMKLPISAVFDYLEEKKGELPATENSLRNFIRYLNETGELKFNDKRRIYTKVPELPYGKQLQIDFGEIKQRNGLKMYIFAAVLSSSRFKYAGLQGYSFKTVDVIEHLLDCFDYIGGIPQEIVIDQDSVMVVNENGGDIIYTNQFEDFKNEMGFSMWVCRAKDPESKGKIENFIKYIKNNFFALREFEGVEEAKESLLKWLERRANGKISQATKKIPSIEIVEERKYLYPIKNSIYRKDKALYREERRVNDKCRIAVDASFYEVPEKYRNGKVEIYKTAGKIFIFDHFTGKQIVEYNISMIPGEVVSNRNLIREARKRSSEWREEILSYFQIEEWKEFVNLNFNNFTRYMRNQCREARNYFKSQEIEEEILKEALKYCLENETYSMKNLIDSYKYFEKMKKKVEDNLVLEGKVLQNKVSSEMKYIRVLKPDIKVYEKIVNPKPEGSSL